MLAQEGCPGLDPALSDSCKGWDAADLVMTGFQLGWLAAGSPEAMESFLRHRDPDLALYESLQGHLATVLIRVIGPIDAPGAESRELAPDHFAEDRT
jgi:hypothetical protein